MTRKQQNRALAYVIAGLLALIAIAFFAKVYGGPFLNNIYEFVRDTSLLIATVVAAYLAGLYQKRTQFLQSLRDQWREIVQAKSALIYYCHLEKAGLEEYLRTARQLSECIDNMRIVYANVGETDKLIGYFPYAPLHHMRVVMESLDPRKGSPTPEQRFAARGEIWAAFNAIREHFLDEFDIEEPTKPILVFQMKRTKTAGAAGTAKRLHDRQAEFVTKQGGGVQDIEYHHGPGIRR
jgi:hypothetical protein